MEEKVMQIHTHVVAFQSFWCSLLSTLFAGETLGAVNSIKALTEGFGPLVFGLLMSAMEDAAFPGLPYVGAGLLSLAAWRRTKRLDELEKGGYFAEKYEVGVGEAGGEIGMTNRGFAGHDIGR